MVKRSLDLVFAAAGLMALTPVMVIAAAAVLAGLGAPILFRDERAGRNGRPFTLLKFRTMIAEQPGSPRSAEADESRLTPSGRLLRRMSVDELPQLWNVVRGDMSLVGPRPLPTRYLSRYSEEQRRRHDVKPGITGWAQIHGRNAISWDERLALDVWYVDHATVWLDVRILLSTVSSVLSRKATGSDQLKIMDEFRGRS